MVSTFVPGPGTVNPDFLAAAVRGVELYHAYEQIRVFEKKIREKSELRKAIRFSRIRFNGNCASLGSPRPSEIPLK
jgi:hypothetical protein